MWGGSVNIAYFNCGMGVSGDMFVASFIDAGLVSIDGIRKFLWNIGLTNVSVDAEKVKRGGLSGTLFKIEEKGVSCRFNAYKDIEAFFSQLPLKNSFKEKALSVLYLIGKAESSVHGVALEDVHFHELGNIDTVVDILCAVFCCEHADVSKCFCSEISLGKGYVNTSHGKIPLPSPATIEILKEFPVQFIQIPAELTTPTGAALVASFSSPLGDLLKFTPLAVGYGAGFRELSQAPNVFRLIYGNAKEEHERYYDDEVVVIEANIDDMNPELCEYVMDRIFYMGARDVFITPIIMKKGRPGIKISVICDLDKEKDICNILFIETPTFGIRTYISRRYILERELISVETPYGIVRVKIGKRNNRVFQVSPEYEDCKKLARMASLPLKEVYKMAIDAYFGK